MRTLLIDNYDSYTFNIANLIERTTGSAPTVWTNDDPRLSNSVNRLFDALVVSPGPGHPAVESDMGAVGSLLRDVDLPVLGICLGHQALAQIHGGTVGRATAPAHGQVDQVRHYGDSLFFGIPEHFEGVRYHSLAVTALGPELRGLAWSADGTVMALRHLHLPRWGVQFHPESVSSEYGPQLFANYFALARRYAEQDTMVSTGATGWSVNSVRINAWAESDVVAELLEIGAAEPGYWLDSSRQAYGMGRFSFLGNSGGPLAERLSFRAGDDSVSVVNASGCSTVPGSIFDLLRDRLKSRQIAISDLPFDFQGGYVGYFGYEMKSECDYQNSRSLSPVPDAVWMFADRFVALDHLTRSTYIVAVDNGQLKSRQSAKNWIARTAKLLGATPPSRPRILLGPTSDHDGGALTLDTIEHSMSRGPKQYLVDVDTCKEYLAAGESYEICITDNIHVPVSGDDFGYYLKLRRLNPAPYSAYIRLAEATVFCSSPERFLSVDRFGRVQSKPIKGTAPRSEDAALDAKAASELVSDPKSRAENLMIVDLIRNDLSRICLANSVHVDPLMAVETYETVHQLVSTVHGQLRPGVDPIECIRACFPGGSMVGAPKKRTLQLIDSIEVEARGVYSGSIGALSLGGTIDMNVVIRTAVRVADELTVGAGGAIVIGSVPASELAEMLMKARAPLRAFIRE